MMSLRRLSLASLALLLVVAGGCRPDRAPTAAPRATTPTLTSPTNDLLSTTGSTLNGPVSGAGGTVSGLLSCPNTQSYSASQTVGAGGGVIQVGPHSLSIPPGALANPVTITATVPVSQYAQVQFEPHGLQFARPSALRMSYAQCGLLSALNLRIAYADDRLNILELLPSVTDIFSQTVTGKLTHFSSYLLAE